MGNSSLVVLQTCHWHLQGPSASILSFANFIWHCAAFRKLRHAPTRTSHTQNTYWCRWWAARDDRAPLRKPNCQHYRDKEPRRYQNRVSWTRVAKFGFGTRGFLRPDWDGPQSFMMIPSQYGWPRPKTTTKTTITARHKTTYLLWMLALKTLVWWISRLIHSWIQDHEEDHLGELLWRR